jgi:hypothetical protein
MYCLQIGMICEFERVWTELVLAHYKVVFERLS